MIAKIKIDMMRWDDGVITPVMHDTADEEVLETVEVEIPLTKKMEKLISKAPGFGNMVLEEV